MNGEQALEWAEAVLGGGKHGLADHHRAMLLAAFGGRLTYARVQVVKAVVAQVSESATLSAWEGDLPKHLPMAVDEDGQGPVSNDEAHHWVCWCGEAGCPLARGLRMAGEAGVRRLVLHPGLESSIARVLARRHKCWDHAGPDSGPCKTDRDRAALVMGTLAGAMLYENRRDEEE